MRIDVRHCLSSPASRVRCVVLEEREKLMGLDPRPQCAGRSLVQMMEDRLDEVVWDLQVHYAAGAGRGTPDFDIRTAELAGEARGIAQCIAFVRTPYAPDVDAIKAASLQRYQERLTALLTAKQTVG